VTFLATLSLQRRLIAVEETTQHIDGWNIAFESEGDALSAARARAEVQVVPRWCLGSRWASDANAYHTEE